MAQRVVERHRLSPPIDLDNVASRYASVEYSPIPVNEVDGIAINLKVSGKRPSIIVNSMKPPNRQRFTLAHELGHVLIPWHTGTIIDDAISDGAKDLDQFDSSDAYYRLLESEANAFAGELLMPSKWVSGLVTSGADPSVIHKTIMDEAVVSSIAALLALNKKLPPGYVFCVIDSDNMVTCSGRSEATLAGAPPLQSEIDLGSEYQYALKMFKRQIGGNSYVWWHLPLTMPLPVGDVEDWRSLLDGMCDDLGLEGKEKAKFTKSLHGSMAYANGMVKRTNSYSPGSIYSACLQRLTGQPLFSSLLKHRKFTLFMKARAVAMHVG